MPEKKSMAKSFTVAPSWRNARIPGIPGQGGTRGVERLLDMPKPPKPLAMLDHNEPRFSPESVVKGLGMDLAQEGEWRNWISRNIGGAANEVVARKNLYTRFIEQRTPPELRKALFQRSMSYFGCMRKSLVQVVTPSELLEKAEARGGTYYRRVADEKGGYRYYYDPEKYHARDDAHVDGETALNKRLQKMVVNHVTESGEGGCDHKRFQALASRFGADKVAAALREATSETGPLKFEKGIFKLRNTEAKQPLQKSERFVVTR